MKKYLSLFLALALVLVGGFQRVEAQGLNLNSPDFANINPGLGNYFAIGANDLALNTLQRTQVTLTTAQIDGMFATPVVLVPSPGAGHSIQVDYVFFRYVSGGTAFASGGVITVGYVGGAAVVNTVAAAVINTITSSDNVLVTGAANVAATQNAGLQINNATGAFTTGNGTITVVVYYSIN